jgi:hypothetical protein
LEYKFSSSIKSKMDGASDKIYINMKNIYITIDMSGVGILECPVSYVIIYTVGARCCGPPCIVETILRCT